MSVALEQVERDHVASAAPLGRRAIAAVLNVALLVATAATLAWTVGAWAAFLGGAAVGIANEYVAVVRTGQSFGWRLMRLQLVGANDGHPPGFGAVFVRNLLLSLNFGFAWHPIPGVPSVILIIGPIPLLLFVPALFDHRWHRALYDRWTHTVLIDASDGRRS